MLLTEKGGSLGRSLSQALRSRLSLRPARLLLLMGTFNKMLLYTASLWGELHCHFHHSLSRDSALVVCGYGFRDKGINTKIDKADAFSLTNKPPAQ